MHNKKLPHKARIEELLSIVASLRHPDTGCQWHLSQDFSSIASYTIEEAYEVLEAIEKSDMPALRDELGDLLFQVVYHARLAEEKQEFDFNDVVAKACEKMVRRHPQVFDTGVITTTKPSKTWEQHKREERKLPAGQSILSTVESKQPAINEAYKLQKKVSSVGFDWDNLQAVIDKLDEEINELKDEIRSNNHSRIEDELGDVLFSCINLARHLQVNPERSLRKTNQRFSRRFAYIEQQLEMSGLSMEECSLVELDALWDQAKNYYSKLDV